jgi:hypothetical protein
VRRGDIYGAGRPEARGEVALTRGEFELFTTYKSDVNRRMRNEQPRAANRRTSPAFGVA